MIDLEPSLQEYEELGRGLVAKALHHERVSRIRRRAATGAVIGVLAVGGIGAAWVVLADQALRTNAAYCHAEADPSSTFVGVGASPAEARDGSVVQFDVDPIELCSAVWRIGAVGPHATQPPVDGVTYDVPELTACLRLDGVVAVFPDEGGRSSEEFCRALGLAPWHG